MMRRFGIAAALACAASPALAQRAFDGDFDVISYGLGLKPDLATATVSGREPIKLQIMGDQVDRLTFSANALTIDYLTVNGQQAATHTTDGKLIVDLPRPLSRGQGVDIRIVYHGKPAHGLIASGTGLHTSYSTCDWMICAQDRFGDKAEFALDLHVPKGMDTLAIGHRIRVRTAPDGGEIHSWKAPRPYSAYLYGFAVGHFVRTGSPELSYLSDSADAAELQRRFAETPDIARFFAEKAGLPLPVKSYTQLLVPGGEAQEAATYSILGLNAVPANPGDPVEDWAIAHELAHQYWGNLITCETLKHFWLNEGITTFMTAAWKEHRFGRAAYDAELDLARRRLERARGLGFDKPLTWNGAYPSLGARRAVQYSKGALFLDHLRTLLGEQAFWAGLQRYTRAHAGGTVTSLDFERAMEAASGKDLHPAFAEWVFGTG